MNLAIKGHPTRGSEVIALLEILGGENTNPVLKGNKVHQIYHIRECNSEIVCGTYTTYGDLYQVFALEEFLEKFPYKVGDKVIKEPYVGAREICEMKWEDNRVKYGIGVGEWFTAQQLQPYKEQPTREEVMRDYIAEEQEIMEDNDILNQLIDYFNNTPREVVEKEWHEYDKYNKIGITVKDYLKYIDSITKPKYPSSYEECCDIMNEYSTQPSITGYKFELLHNCRKLLICRDTYWKIAGDWKPDLRNNNQTKYVITNVRGNIAFERYGEYNAILAFPTEEMRDAFYENFKDLIEQCKELL